MGSFEMKFLKTDCWRLNSPDLSPGRTQSVIVAFAPCVDRVSQGTLKRSDTNRTRQKNKTENELRTDIVNSEAVCVVVGFLRVDEGLVEVVIWDNNVRRRAMELDMDDEFD